MEQVIALQSLSSVLEAEEPDMRKISEESYFLCGPTPSEGSYYACL